MKRLFLLIALVLPLPLFAASGLDAVTVTTNPEGGETYSLSIQLLMLMTVLTFLPAAVMMMTAFTRIIIVLAILRQAIGLMQAPSGQVMVGLALFLTFFVMAPVIEKINNDGLQPYFEDKISLQQGLQNSAKPLREFMMGQVKGSLTPSFMIRWVRFHPLQ